MAFKISSIGSSTYRWTVKVSYPTENGGSKTESFAGLFNRLSTSEIEDLIQDNSAYVQALEANEPTDGLLSQRGMAERIWAGWPEGEILDDDGEPLASNSANISKLLEVPDVVQAVIAAWGESRDKSRSSKSEGRR